MEQQDRAAVRAAQDRVGLEAAARRGTEPGHSTAEERVDLSDGTRLLVRASSDIEVHRTNGAERLATARQGAGGCGCSPVAGQDPACEGGHWVGDRWFCRRRDEGFRNEVRFNGEPRGHDPDEVLVPMGVAIHGTPAIEAWLRERHGLALDDFGSAVRGPDLAGGLLLTDRLRPRCRCGHAGGPSTPCPRPADQAECWR